MDNVFIDKVQKHVNDFFNNQQDEKLTYHTLTHTNDMAAAAEKIGRGSHLSEEELEIVLIAAWFHDTGYLSHPENHEPYSAQLAEEFLRTIDYPEEKIKKVGECILSTQINYQPLNLMEQVIRDADYINLASPDSFKKSKLLQTESVNFGSKKLPYEEWLTQEIDFLKSHQYHTEYAKNKLGEQKKDNIKKLKKKLRKYNEAMGVSSLTPVLTENGILKTEEVKTDHEEKKNIEKKRIKSEILKIRAEIEEKKRLEKERIKNEEIKIKAEFEEKKRLEKEKLRSDALQAKIEREEKNKIEKKEDLSIKGFENVFRLTSSNHMRLNAIADRKANIMLSLSGIIISISLSKLTSDFDLLIIPTCILVFVCLLTIVFATLSTRPKVSRGKVTREAISEEKANLLFFGNFAKLPFEDFDWGLRKMIRSQDYLHNSMIQDFYFLGKVLNKKFAYLRICYNVFMYGMIVSVIAFILASFSEEVKVFFNNVF